MFQVRIYTSPPNFFLLKNLQSIDDYLEALRRVQDRGYTPVGVVDFEPVSAPQHH